MANIKLCRECKERRRRRRRGLSCQVSSSSCEIDLIWMEIDPSRVHVLRSTSKIPTKKYCQNLAKILLFSIFINSIFLLIRNIFKNIQSLLKIPAYSSIRFLFPKHGGRYIF